MDPPVATRRNSRQRPGPGGGRDPGGSGRKIPHIRRSSMNRATVVRAVAAAGIVAVAAAVAWSTLVPRPAEAQRKVTWKMASAFGSKLPHLGTSATRFADNIKVMSGGSLELK